MTANDIRNAALGLIDRMQRSTDEDANKDYLLYLMAYNDGVIHLTNKLIELIESEEKESEVSDAGSD